MLIKSKPRDLQVVKEDSETKRNDDLEPYGNEKVNGEKHWTILWGRDGFLQYNASRIVEEIPRQSTFDPLGSVDVGLILPELGRERCELPKAHPIQPSLFTMPNISSTKTVKGVSDDIISHFPSRYHHSVT